MGWTFSPAPKVHREAGKWFDDQEILWVEQGPDEHRKIPSVRRR